MIFRDILNSLEVGQKVYLTFYGGSEIREIEITHIIGEYIGYIYFLENGTPRNSMLRFNFFAKRIVEKDEWEYRDRKREIVSEAVATRSLIWGE